MLAQAAETHLAAAAVQAAVKDGNDSTSRAHLEAALTSLNLRIAMLQSLTSVAVSPTELASTILSAAACHLALGDPSAAAAACVSALSVLGLSGRSVTAGRARVLQGCALVLNGSPDAGLALYAQALTSGVEHVGPLHPCLADWAAAMATALTAIGRHAAAATLLEGGAELLMRVLGRTHPSVAPLWAQTGQAYAAAATVAASAAAEAEVEEGAAAAEAHRQQYLLRAAFACEKAAGLYTDLSSAHGHTSSSTSAAAAGEVWTCMASVLTSQGQPHQALSAATKAVELTKAAVASGASPPSSLLPCLQQLASLCSSMGRHADACDALDAMLVTAQAQQQQENADSPQLTGAAAQAAGLLVRAILASQPSTIRSVIPAMITSVTASVTAGSQEMTSALAYVGASLAAPSQPSAFIRSVLSRCLPAFSRGALSVSFQLVEGRSGGAEPPIGHVMAAMVLLADAAEVDAAAGVQGPATSALRLYIAERVLGAQLLTTTAGALGDRSALERAVWQ